MRAAPGHRCRRGAAALLLLAPLLAGCYSLPEAANPVAIYDRVIGKTFADRTPPPGLNEPFPNLSTVPARPNRPELRAREEVSRALVDDRTASRDAEIPTGETPAMADAPGRGPGDPNLPGAPPAPPRLAEAKPVPWNAPVSPVAPQPGGVPAAPSIDVSPAPPAPPPPDLLAPAPAR